MKGDNGEAANKIDREVGRARTRGFPLVPGGDGVAEFTKQGEGGINRSNPR